MNARRSAAGPETDADKIVEAIDNLKTTLDQRLEIVGEELGRISDECRWACNQIRDLFGSVRIDIERVSCAECSETVPLADGIRDGWTEVSAYQGGFIGLCKAHQAWEQAEGEPTSTDREDPRTNEKLNASDRETIFCTLCPAPSPDSLRDALRAGWTCLIDDEGNDRGDFAGHCGDCSRKLEESEPSAVQEAPIPPLAEVEIDTSPAIVCDACNTESTVSKARTAGWSDMEKWKNGEKPWLGICPACQDPEEPKKILQELKAARQKKTLF